MVKFQGAPVLQSKSTSVKFLEQVTSSFVLISRDQPAGGFCKLKQKAPELTNLASKQHAQRKCAGHGKVALTHNLNL